MDSNLSLLKNKKIVNIDFKPTEIVTYIYKDFEEFGFIRIDLEDNTSFKFYHSTNEKKYITLNEKELDYEDCYRNEKTCFNLINYYSIEPISLYEQICNFLPFKICRIDVEEEVVGGCCGISTYRIYLYNEKNNYISFITNSLNYKKLNYSKDYNV